LAGSTEYRRENQAKNWPKAKSADKVYNLTKSADSFSADFVAKSACVFAALGCARKCSAGDSRPPG